VEIELISMPRIECDNQNFPDWAELKFYEIVTLKQNERKNFNSTVEKQVLFMCKGSCSFENGTEISKVSKGDVLEIKNDKTVSVFNSSIEQVLLIMVGGSWGNEIGGRGVFSLSSVEHPKNLGDATSYWRNTELDNHYHDCDEYWIFFEGNGVAVSEDKFYRIEPGICIATKMGDHHDMPVVHETLGGIYFETTLKGKKRIGHLWNHTHAI